MTEIERLREAKLVEWLRRMGTGGHPDQLNPDERYMQAADCIVLLRAALSTPPVAERGEWKGIETAPKDGTRILLAGCGSGGPDIDIGSWGGFGPYSRATKSYGLGWGTSPHGGIKKPTDWQPLPAPPSPRTPEGQ